MFFRERGNRVQCIRARYDKSKRRCEQEIVFSFVESTDDIKGIDPLLVKRLSKDEREKLKDFLSKDRRIIASFNEQASLCSIALKKKSFDRTSDIKGMKRAIANLNRTILKVGL